MFGGFGSTANTGFGQQPQQQQQQQQPNAGGGLFGGGASSGFGAAPAFGQQQQQQPAFGAQPQQNTGFGAGGFGVNTSFGSTAARPAFGAQSATTAGPGLFGQPQQQQQNTGFGFGAQPQQQQSGLFGAQPQQQTSTGFGTPATTSFGFGAAQVSGAAGATTPSFGGPGQTTPTTNCGTGNPAYVVTQERESTGALGAGSVSQFHAISAMPAYKNWSFEELRVQDYLMNKKFSTQAPGMGGATGAFGTPAAGGFGSTSGGFGASNTGGTGGLFGSTPGAGQGTGFGFGSATAQPASTGLFGAPATTGGGLFGSNTGTGAFGQPAAATGTFGQPAATTGAFGQPPAGTGGAFSFGGANNAAPNTGFGFGSATTTPAFGAVNTSTFGQPAATGAFGQPAASTGAFGTASNTSGGLFGNKTAGTSPFGGGGAAGGGLFGQPAATTGAFGQPAANQSPFGQPAANTGGGLFGNTQQQPTSFGGATTTPATGGLFGSQPASGGFGGFGATANKPATGGLFGSQPTTPGTGGFGGFGTTPTPSAGGGGLFGSANTGFGGGFGQSTLGGGGFSLGGATQQPQQSGSLFGGGGLTGGFNLGGSMLGQSQQPQQQQQQPTLTAAIDKNPYGNNPLFNTSLKSKESTAGGAGGGAKEAPALFSTSNEDDGKKLAVLPHYKMTPKSASKIKLRGFTPSRIPGDFFGATTGSAGAGIAANGTGAAMGISPANLPKSVLGMLKEEAGDVLGGSGSFKPRVKKLVITDEGAENEVVGIPGSALSTPAAASVNRSVRFLDENRAVKAPVVDVTASVAQRLNSAAASASPSKSASTSRNSRSPSPRKSPKAAPVYETEPSYEELMQLSDTQLTQVEGYTIRLAGFGSVRFLEPVNLLQASPSGTRSGIARIPGEVVILRHKAIEVYPDEERKDPVGMGVNVPAEVSLDKCWAVDKASGSVIVDETDPRFDRHFKKLEGIEGTRLLGFNKKTGQWRFRVEHFSKYGMEDDEEEEEGEEEKAAEGLAGVPVGSVPLRAGFDIEDDVELLEGEEYEEDEEEEGGESISFAGNDSFAHIAARRPVAGVRGTGDLRKVATMNRLALGHMQQRRQQQVRNPVRVLDEILSSSESETEEAFADSHAGDVEKEEEEAGGEDVDKYSIHVVGASIDQDEEEQEVDIMESNQEEELLSNVNAFKPRMSFGGDARRISAMSASLFGGITGKGAQPVFGGHASPSVNKFASPSNSKRALDAIMDIDAADGKLNYIDGNSEFQSFPSPKAIKMLSMAPVASAVNRTSPRKDEHVVPVVAVVQKNESLSPKRALPSQADLCTQDPTALPMPVLNESIVMSRSNHVVDAGLFMGRSFRGGWGPKGEFAVSGRTAGSDSVSQVKIVRVSAFSWETERDKSKRTALAETEKARHIKCLELILNRTAVYSTRAASNSAATGEANRVVVTGSLENRSLLQSSSSIPQAICPLGVINRGFQFSELMAVVSSRDNSAEFGRDEPSVWMLASAIFDDIDDAAIRETISSEKVIDEILTALRKERISDWLRKSIADKGVPTASSNSADTVFAHLLSRKVADAIATAIKNRDFRLATTLSQVAGVGGRSVVRKSGSDGLHGVSAGHGVVSRSSMNDLAREHIVYQIHVWMADAEQNGIAPEYLKLWKLISGDLRVWDAAVVGAAQDWRQALGLFLWYAEGGGLSLNHALAAYDDAWKAGSGLHAKPPILAYLADKGTATTLRRDICYNLLKVVTDDSLFLESLLLPAAVGRNLLDHRVSWLLWLVLSRAKMVREFSTHTSLVQVRSAETRMDHDGDEDEDDDVLGSFFVSGTADACTLSLCASLGALGLWQWAIFVALFLSTQAGREAVVRDILARDYPLADVTESVGGYSAGMAGKKSAEWLFLVERLGIPSAWIHEAKAFRARYEGDIVRGGF
ncbi:nuclear protein 96-domain-containing protein [Chytriomyces sp. MP71]|nr:nuclear protein 96-domain-containing protein [Chytriomyces sp. MP71]